MSTGIVLSQHFLLDLYLSKPTEHRQPVLQIIGFQTSDQNPKQIIIRLSDGSNFFDATLIGPYQIKGPKIITSPFATYNGLSMEFSKYGAIKILDFFSKVDDTKICRLKMMIRKIVHAGQLDSKINKPEELSFYVQFNNLLEVNSPPINLVPQQTHKFQGFYPKNIQQIHCVEIKICDDDDDENVHSNVISNQNDTKRQPILQSKQVKRQSVLQNKQVKILNYCKTRNPDEPLTYRDVVNGEQGFFIGRLVRLKHTFRQNKDGSLPMLMLGFLDCKGQMLRINLLGKTAVREQKQLKKGNCYYLKGLQVVNLKGSSYIKLRQKDYKMYVLNEQTITGQYAQQYYHWQHQYDYIDNQNVDVIGTVEDVEQKTFYGVKAVGEGTEPKEVVRVVLRNKFKTVKISFWSDQLKNLAKYNLKKGEVIIIQDVKKKKIVFLDFAIESNLIRVEPQSELYIKFFDLLPEYHEYPQPINISEIYAIQQLDRFNTKVHNIYAYLAKIQEEKLILKVCDICKKKININSQICYQCKGSVMSFRYNTSIEINDYSGSMTLTVFDNVAEKLLGVSALRLKQMKQNMEQYQKFIDSKICQPYYIGVEIKNQRFMLRSVEQLKEGELVDWCQSTVRQIQKLHRPNQEAVQSKSQ